MTQLTKLGDVARYLRKGDVFTWDGTEYRFDHIDSSIVHARTESHRSFAFAMSFEVELVNPRWATPYEVCAIHGFEAIGTVLRRDGVVGVGGALPEGGTAIHWLCRELNGQLEPVRAEESVPAPTAKPRLVKGSELRVGDEWRHPNDGATFRITALDYCGDADGLTSVCVNGCDSRIAGESYNTNKREPVELLSRPEYREATRADVPPDSAPSPAPAEQDPTPRLCHRCEQRPVFAGSNAFCGDCAGELDSNLGTLFPERHRATNRFRGFRPEPPQPDRLTPGQRYHLQDDCDVFGIPGGNG